MKKKGGILVVIVVVIAIVAFGIWITSKPSNQEENVEINLKGLSFDKDTGAEGEPCEIKLVGKTYISGNSKHFDIWLAGYQTDPDRGGVFIDGEKSDIERLFLSDDGSEFLIVGYNRNSDYNSDGTTEYEICADAELEFLIICSYDENDEIDRLIVTPAETKEDALKLINELLPKVIGEGSIQAVEEWKALLE